MSFPGFIRTLLAVALAILPHLAVSAESLISRPGDAPPVASHAVAAPHAAAGRVLAREVVAVDPAVLAAAPEALWLDLTPGEPRLAYLTDLQRTPDGGLVWRGRFAEDDPDRRTITLSLHGGLVSGLFEDGDHLVSLRPTATGAELVTHAGGGGFDCATGRDAGALEALPAAATAGPVPPSSPPELLYRATAAPLRNDGRDVALLVLLLPDVAGRFANQAQTIAYGHEKIDLTNTAYFNSRVEVNFFLAGIGVWDTAPGSTTMLLNQAQNSDFVESMRNAVGADIVGIVSGSGSSGCGEARLMTKSRFGPQMAALAHQVTNFECEFADHRIFVHETAHVLGAQHIPENSTPPDQVVFPYAHGYETPSFRTIMATDPTHVIFSNPLVSIGGIPAGVENERDNARALNQTVPTGAAWRTGNNPLPPPAPTNLQATALSETEIRLQWQDNSRENAFEIEVRLAGGDVERLTQVGFNRTEAVIDGLEPGTAYAFRVRARGSQANSAYSAQVTASTDGGAPAAPTGLTAEPVTTTGVALAWDAVDGADSYEVELHGADPGLDRAANPIAVNVDGTLVTALVEGLEVASPYTFGIRAVNAQGASPFAEASASTLSGAPPGPCVADAGTLCLLDDRFAVTAAWRNPRAPFNFGTGAAQPAPGSERTGLFTFFNPQNVELAVKMLDGRGLNGAFWHFFGALSDVEYWVTARDTMDGTSRTYHNPPFEICGRGDTGAFPVPEAPAAALAPQLVSTTASEEACEVGSETLCLANGRFEVEVDWTNPRLEGDEGVGRVFAATGGELTGHFWFFRPDNLELSVKILDGRAINGHYWILWGGLSDVGYTIRVTDTTTTEVHEFENPPLTLCGGAETGVL